MNLDKDRAYVMVMVSREEDTDVLGTTAMLRRMGCTAVPCINCRKPCLANPESMKLMDNSIHVCLRCGGVVADQMENLDDETRRHFHGLAESIRREIGRKRSEVN